MRHKGKPVTGYSTFEEPVPTSSDLATTFLHFEYFLCKGELVPNSLYLETNGNPAIEIFMLTHLVENLG